MTISRTKDQSAFVWIWLPTATEPVVAGKVTSVEGRLLFNYGKSYLDRPDAISLYDAELPLQAGELPLLPGLTMPGCLRDASPDAWGRRVLINNLLGLRGANADTAQLDELTYLLESGSDRIGALDFQRSATEYIPRASQNATLEDLLASADRVEQGVPLSPELDQALHHGTAIGGARPKALIQEGDVKYIAKFASSTDTYGVVNAEFMAMRLASFAGLDVAPVRLVQASNRDVLLIERFDRRRVASGWQRRSMVSALTLFALDELMARYASYQDLAEIIRHRFADPRGSLAEMYSRLVFNVLCGNTDDHARNHAAFWDGHELTLTPAYDICPQARSGDEASQAMLIDGDDRSSRLSTCLKAAHHFLLKPSDAQLIAENQIAAIAQNWDRVADEARLTTTDRKLFRGRQFLNAVSIGRA